MPTRKAYIKTICSDLQSSDMDTYIMLHIIKVPLLIFTSSFDFGSR